MKYTLLFTLLISFVIIACSEDPCETPDNLECTTQDFDGDGVLNGDDDEPSNPCSPNFPAFEDLLIGTWTWTISGTTGIIKFNADGTYEEIENEILSNGDVVSRQWEVTGFVSTLELDIENSDGLSAGLNLQSKTIDCTRITFDGQIFGDIIFTKQ